MSSWVAGGFGALDLRGHDLAKQGYDVVVTPAHPGPPVFLMGKGAQTWLQLSHGAVTEADLDEEGIEIARGLVEMGVAIELSDSVGAIEATAPWLASPLHELVYALLANVARENDIEIVFIKGPTMHAQGLRAREHSGDVDCWVRPGDDLKLADAMVPWGWTPLLSPFTGTGVVHSLTLRAGAWGCAIDVHSRFPGMTVPPLEAFDLVVAHSEKRVFAGMPCRTPDRVAHSIIGALHGMRPTVGRTPTDADAQNAAYMLGAGGADALTLVSEFGAGYALARPLRQAFPDEAVGAIDTMPPEDWEWRMTSSAPRRHLKALATVPLRQRPVVVAKLLWQSKATLQAAAANAAEVGSLRQRWVGNLQRIGSAFVGLIKG